MNIRIAIVAIASFIGAYVNSLAQSNPGLPQIIPPSPDAASLGKYGEIPVGKYNGTANISVPVYTIDFDGLKIPVTLNYHSGGIKVEELASWVGLGWSLSAGGIITKTVVGLPDDMAGGGYLNNPYSDITAIQGLTDAEQEQIGNNVKNGQLDLEPDNYYFNFLGYSGKLFIDKATGTVHTIPKTNLKFNYPGWEIIDAAGFRYLFNEGESTMIDNNIPGTQHNFTTAATKVLTKIISPSGNEITFSYQDYSNLYFTRGGQSLKYIVSGGCSCEGHSCVDGYDQVKTNYVVNEVSGKRIQEISWNGGKIVFNKTANNREDIKDDYSLDNIEVYNMKNILVQKHKLFYSYGGSSSGMNLFASNITSLIGAKRLYLDSVKQIGISRDIPPYKFEYEGKNNLPYYLSNAQDHWGYFNGETGNNNLLPLIGVAGYDDRTFGFAKRNVSTANAKTGTLKKIFYPTGGSSQFHYESNEALVDVCSFVYTINPNNIYGLTPQISVSVNQNNPEAALNVPPAICGEAKKKFSYIVNFPNPINCPAGTRDCVGTLQVVLLNTATAERVSLLNNPIVNGQTRGEVKLVAGATYILTLDGSGTDVNGVSATVNGYSNPVVIPGTNKVRTNIGGLRIAKVESIAEGSPALTTKYNYFDRVNVLDTAITGQITSGRIAGLPRYTYHDDYNVYFEYETLSSGTASVFAYCRYLNLFANSLSPMSGESSSPAGYKMVEEIQESDEDKIKQVSTFTTTEQYPDGMNNTYPFTLTTSNDFLRGLPLKEYTLNFNRNTKTYSLLKETENNYFISEDGIKKIWGLRYSCTSFYRDMMMFLADIPMTCNSSLFSLYHRRSQWFYLSSTTEKEYSKDDPSKFLQTQVKYTYGNVNHLQLTKTEVTNSKGEVITSENKYPHDFSSQAPYDLMVQKNIISPVVQQKSFNVTNNKELTFQNTVFGVLPNNTVKPLRIEKSNSGLPPETEIQYTNYDDKGNLRQFIARDGIINSVIWGYNQQYPVAKITGKSYDDAVTQSGIDLAIINNPLTNENTLRTELNKLRALQGSFVHTYTYNPLVGITSETDPRGRSTYYYYDVFNRLVVIKDQDNNIIKKICYNYAGQPEDCNTPCLNTTPDWQNTATPYRCQQDAWGNNNGYVEYEQKDMNACSPTYNQLRWDAVLNEDICPAAIAITSNNTTGLAGYFAEYTSLSTAQVYLFRILQQPHVQTIGSLPAGHYRLKIFNPSGGTTTLTFGSGCSGSTAITGVSALFPDIVVNGMPDCNVVTINN